MANRKQEEAAERLEIERNAPRLASLIPSLVSLRLDMQEHTATSSSRYRKPVMVASAPALFVIRCGDERCEHGGHDLTQPILNALRARQSRSSGEHTCQGSVGSAECGRRLQYELFAEYQATN